MYQVLNGTILTLNCLAPPVVAKTTPETVVLKHILRIPLPCLLNGVNSKSKRANQGFLIV